MRVFISLLITGLTLFLFQATLLHYIPFISKKIDLLPILVVYLGLYSTLSKGGLLSLFLGYTIDTFSGGFLGLYTGLYLFIFFMAKLCWKHFIMRSVIHEASIVTLCIFMAGLLFILALKVLLPTYSTPSIFFIILPQTLLTGIISPLFFMLFKKISIHRAWSGYGDI